MIKRRLENLRDERDLKQKDIAKFLNVNESTYSEWENEKTSIPTKRLYTLAIYFEVNIDYMVGLTDNKIKMKSVGDIDLKLVSERLKEIRKSLKMTMRELADKFNTSSSAISNYENAKFLILGSLLIDLCKFSNYSIDWVLGRSEDKFIK